MFMTTSGPRPMSRVSPVKVPTATETSSTPMASRFAWARFAISLAIMFISGEFASTMAILPSASFSTANRSSYFMPSPTTVVTARFMQLVQMALTLATALPMTVGTILFLKYTVQKTNSTTKIVSATTILRSFRCFARPPLSPLTLPCICEGSAKVEKARV